MARRKRLLVPPAPSGPSEVPLRSRPPIAEVAAGAAGQAATEEMARALETVEAEGRVVRRIPLAALDVDMIERDRVIVDDEEAEALQASIAARGQQTPIEVVETATGYGLISGMRRVRALRALGQGEVLALVRKPETATDTYVAMVEENEIRADLTFWERAGIARRAVEAGVFPDVTSALGTLFRHTTKSRRSKIGAFAHVMAHLGDDLAHPLRLSERVGVALAAAMRADPGVAGRVRAALAAVPDRDADAERTILQDALAAVTPKANSARGGRPKAKAPADGIRISGGAGRVTLSGAGVDEAFLERLRDWVSHAKP